MRVPLFLAAVLLGASLGGSGVVWAGEVEDFLVGQGCAIGPGTLALAAKEGIPSGAIEAVLAEAEGDADVVRTGDWVVLPPRLCTIRPPVVKSRIGMSDPEVKAATSAIDAYAEFGDIGCFLEGPGLAERVQATRGWDADMANREYLQFLAENLGNGNLAFYRDTALSTPPGIQVLTGDCANVPNIEEIRASLDLRDRYLDQLIREDAEGVSCESDEAPSYIFMDRVAERTKGKNTNAWLFAEVRFIAMGAGWYEGVSATEKGRPRPPLCRLEAR